MYGKKLVELRAVAEKRTSGINKNKERKIAHRKKLPVNKSNRMGKKKIIILGTQFTYAARTTAQLKFQ